MRKVNVLGLASRYFLPANQLVRYMASFLLKLVFVRSSAFGPKADLYRQRGGGTRYREFREQYIVDPEADGPGTNQVTRGIDICPLEDSLAT